MKFSEIKLKHEIIEQSKLIVNASIFFDNLGNFECFNDKELIDNIFKLSCLLEGYSHCTSYDFDHISYALLGWCSEHEEDEIGELLGILINDCISGEIDEDQLNMIWEMVETYNDIDGDFEKGRVINGRKK